MFNDLSQDPNQNNDKKVDDIFAETDSAPQAENIKSQVAGLSANSQTPDDSNEEDGGGNNKKTKMIILLVLAIVILAAAVYLVYSKLMSSPEGELNPEPFNKVPDKVVEPPIVQEDLDTVTPEPEELEPEDEVIIPFPGQPVVPEESLEIDSDGDGLSDEEESRQGTNPLSEDSDADGLSDYDEVMNYNTDPLNPDSDGDGLTDYEEVMNYNTDPLNPDSDGDGFSDGEEVANKYNPLGDGPLVVNP